MANGVTESVVEALAKLRTDLPSPATSVRVDDALVVDTIRRLDQSGVVEKVTQWGLEDAKAPGGAPEQFPKRALLVAMFVCARMGWPMLATVWTNTMWYAFSDAMRAELGIPSPRLSGGWPTTATCAPGSMSSRISSIYRCSPRTGASARNASTSSWSNASSA